MQQTLTPLKHQFNKRMTMPGSKSITNRALLLAALAKGRSHLHGMLDSTDSKVFADCLQQLGITLHWDKSRAHCEVSGCGGRFSQPQATLYCQDAGTAARFLLAACAQSPGEYYLHASPRLEQRPLAELMHCLRQQGMQTRPAHSHGMPFTVIGTDRLAGGSLHVSGKESSQFISALLLVAPLAKTDVRLTIDDTISRPYVDMTVAMMRSFGIELEAKHNAFIIPATQHYRACDYTIEPDLSTASYFLAAAALTQSTITIEAMHRHDCLQGDIAFIDVLAQMGCTVTEHDHTLSLSGPAALQGIDVDMNAFSDTFMTLACIAPFATSKTTIRNIAHVRLQECDRLQAVSDNFKRLHIKHDITHDSLTIYPSQAQTTTIDSFNDHRIAMAFSLIGLRCEGLSITNANCVAKTCPQYFALLKSLYE